MKIFHVSQSQTHKVESKGEYLWSPQTDKKGNRNIGYDTMTEVKKGDVIFHGADSQTYALSVANTDCYEANQPKLNKIAAGKETWNDEGYRIDSDYTILKAPLDMLDHCEWLADHHVEKTAFTRNGQRDQSYLKKLPKKQAEYILYELMKLPQDNESLQLINSLLIKIDKNNQ